MKFIPPLALLVTLCTAASAQPASLRIAWDPISDRKVAGYRIHYGPESKRYTKTLEVRGRLKTQAVITDIEEGKQYYFCVSAFSAEGQESECSEEMSTASNKAAAANTPEGTFHREERLEAQRPPNAPPGTVEPGQAEPAAQREKPDGKIQPSRYRDTQEGKRPPTRQVPGMAPRTPPPE